MVKNGWSQIRLIPACSLSLIWCASTASLDVSMDSKTLSQSARAVRGEFASISPNPGGPKASDLKFAHLTTNDGLSQGYVVRILQDRRGFMWFATRDGLNRYDGNAFVVYKSNPKDPGSLSSSFIQDLMEDDHGYLWVATDVGVNRFDPGTERCTRYLHDPHDPNSLGGASVKSIVQDSSGSFWFGSEGSGLDNFDPTTGKFTHYLDDSDGQFVGRISRVVADKDRDIWFVGERGLFHLNRQTGQITRPRATRNIPRIESVYRDEAGNLWMLADSRIATLLKYDPKAERLTRYPFGAPVAGVLASTASGGSLNGSIVADGQYGLWVPSSQGLFYFDRRTERFTYRFRHDETDPDSLDSDAIMSVYRDRGGVLWVGTENAGPNILNFRQEQFGRLVHRPADPNSISPGRVKAIYEDPNGALWAGLFPRALDRLNQKTGKIRHFVSARGRENTLGEGTNVAAIYKDASGYLWVGGGGAGLVRFDERTGQFKQYRHKPDDPDSLISDNIFAIFGDRTGRLWIGQEGGLSRFDPATGKFANYKPLAETPSILANTVWVIYQDHSGALWLGTWGGAVSRFDEKTNTFVNYMPDPHDPQKLNGGGINSLHEDRTGTLWVGAMDGLYRFNQQSGAFARYTESQGLPSSSVRCILEDKVGRLWLSTQKGVSRFDPQTEAFRNYDVFDGLQSNEFSTGCYQGRDGEMFFGGSNGLNAFFPENVRDDPYVPPVVITSFKIFNKPVPIAPKSVLTKAVPYVDSLTLSYRDNVFSFEFAALSYANSHKNRYRYKLENFDHGWNEVGSKQRLATYTNLNAGKYVFRVQGSNSDGVWNEEGVSLTVIITPPWWNTTWFRALCAFVVLVLLWGAYRFRLRQVRQEVTIGLEAKMSERTRIARELHDTLLQSFHGLLLRFQVARNLLPGHLEEAIPALDYALDLTEQAIAEGRDSIQELRSEPFEETELDESLIAIGQEQVPSNHYQDGSPCFRVIVEGERRDLPPLIKEQILQIARELIRNAFKHSCARAIESEIRYESGAFRLIVRDNGRGIDPQVLKDGGRAGHWGMQGVQERALGIGARVEFWSEAGVGTEVRLTVPATVGYVTRRNAARFRLFRKWRNP